MGTPGLGVKATILKKHKTRKGGGLLLLGDKELKHVTGKEFVPNSQPSQENGNDVTFQGTVIGTKENCNCYWAVETALLPE